MKKSKLIQLLKTFTKDELNEFEKYLNSPLSNCSSYILNYFYELKIFYPDFSDENVESKIIFKKIYKNKEYNDSTVRSIVSNLIHNVEQFLSYRKFKEENIFGDYYLLAELRTRELNDYYDARSRQILKKINSGQKMDLGNFLSEFLIHLEITGYRLYNNRYDESAESIKDLCDSLLVFFSAYSTFAVNYTDNLLTFHEIKVDSLLNNNFFKNFNYKKFADSLNGDESSKAKFLRLNYHMYCLILNKDIHLSFFNLKEIWLSSKDFLSNSMRKSLYDFLGNFCIIQNRLEDSPYEREFFEISKVMLQDELFLIDSNVIQFNTFRHIFRNSLKLNEFEWAEFFAENYSKYLMEEEKEMLVEMSKAEIFFEKGDYEKSLDHLALTKMGVRYLRLEIRELFIKIYYEVNYFESLFSSVDSFRHYLKNSPFSTENTTSAKNFLNAVMSIIQCRENNSPENFYSLKKIISEENNIHHKKWLLEKLNESDKITI